MIVSLITGGLGNQLAMYAFGRALAKKHNHQLCVDTRQYTNEDESNRYTLHEYVLDRTSLKPKVVEQSELVRMEQSGTCKLLTEKKLRYSESIWGLNEENIFINMYASDYRYSLPIINELREELTPMVPMVGEFAGLYDEMRDGETLSMHVRLQDYVRNPHCFNLPKVYYQDALQVVRNNGVDPRIYLFTDEPELVVKSGPWGFDFTIISNGPKRNLEDMTLMTACKHHVIANSSYSFWGAWLDGRGGGVTVAPDTYYRPDCKQLMDTYEAVIQPEYPPDWNVVKVR
jgi:hypothetical protein